VPSSSLSRLLRIEKPRYCMADGCKSVCIPSMSCCRTHWDMLPRSLQVRLELLRRKGKMRDRRFWTVKQAQRVWKQEVQGP
jgi:hypothetical protein